MEALLDSLKPSVLLIVVFVFSMRIYAYITVNRRLKAIPYESTESLQNFLKSKKHVFYNPVIKELKNRDESYESVLPNVIDLMLSKNPATRIMGWIVIDNHFPDIAKNIEYSNVKLSEDTIRELKRIRNTL